MSAVLGDGTARQLLVFLASTGRLVTSHMIIDEFSAAVTKTALAERVTPRMTAQFVAYMERHGSIVRPHDVEWVTNPKDAKVIGTAMAGQATLVTGDALILDEASRFDVRAISIRSALEELDLS